MTNSYDIECFCKNLKAIRKSKKLSIEKMAKKLGIGAKSLSLIEKGVIPPRLGTNVLFKIYNEFGVLPSEIFSPMSGN